MKKILLLIAFAFLLSFCLYSQNNSLNIEYKIENNITGQSLNNFVKVDDMIKYRTIVNYYYLQGLNQKSKVKMFLGCSSGFNFKDMESKNDPTISYSDDFSNEDFEYLIGVNAAFKYECFTLSVCYDTQQETNLAVAITL